MFQAKAICNEFVDDVCANQRTQCCWNGINITNLLLPTLFKCQCLKHSVKFLTHAMRGQVFRDLSKGHCFVRVECLLKYSDLIKEEHLIKAEHLIKEVILENHKIKKV